MKISVAYYILILFFVQGCSTGIFSVHKIDIQQGNAIDDERLALLEKGMTTSQVRYLLGEPVLRHPFRSDERWDYIYYFKPGDGEAETRRLIVLFEDMQVVDIEKQH